MHQKHELHALKMRLAHYDRQMRWLTPARFKTPAEFQAAKRELWIKIYDDLALFKSLKGKF